MTTKTDKCKWEYDDYVWDTSCGNVFIIEYGTPKQNRMKFCCYCGKTIEQRTEGEPHDNQD